MPPTSNSLFLFWYLHTSQLLCHAAPIIIEMNRTYPLTGEIVETRIKLDDSVMERILLEQLKQSPPSIKEATNTPETYEGFYDYYDSDCAMPYKPEIIYDEEQKETLTVRQTSPSRAHTVMDSIVGSLNGIALSVMAAGIGAYNFFTFSS